MTEKETTDFIIGVTTFATLVGLTAGTIVLNARRLHWRKKYLEQNSEHLLHNLKHHPETTK